MPLLKEQNQENFEILSPLELPQWSLSELLDMIGDNQINANPIGQRPPTSSPKKTLVVSREIIETIFRGYSVGSIILRNIINDGKARDVYNKVFKYLVIDGGHRIRAIQLFKDDKFKVFGYTYSEHLDNYLNYPGECHPGFVHFYEEYKILVEIYECSEKQAGELFKSRNKSTPVNDMEMIMSNETSYIARKIRSMVSRYKEYGNVIHDIFIEEVKKNGDVKPKYWNSDFNPRRKWDEYVAVIALKVIGRSNVSSKYSDIDGLINQSSLIMENGTDEEIQKHVKEVNSIFNSVEKFFNGFLEVIKHSKRGIINGHFFGAYQAVYFRLLETCDSSGNLLKINDIKSFSKKFSQYHSKLAGNTQNQYDDDLRPFKFSGQYDSVKSFCRKNGIAFASPEKQNDTADVYIEEAGLQKFVTKLDKRRTVSKKTKREMLADQDGLCFIDGLPLELEEAIFGHDTPWSDGGRIEEGKIIRKSHNVNMGTMTIQEYKEYLRFKSFRSNGSLETC